MSNQYYYECHLCDEIAEMGAFWKNGCNFSWNGSYCMNSIIECKWRGNKTEVPIQ
jgi:hypothetical protein